MDRLITTICDRLEAGGTRVGRALAAIWRSGRPAAPEPAAQVSSPVNIYTYVHDLIMKFERGYNLHNFKRGTVPYVLYSYYYYTYDYIQTGKCYKHKD
jgi:hypothetical protein